MSTPSNRILLELTTAANESSQAARISILRALFTGGHCLEAKEFVHCVLDPAWNYYLTTAQIPEPSVMVDPPYWLAYDTAGMLGLLYAMHARSITGNEQLAVVADFLYHTDPATKALFKIAIDRKLPGGIGRTLVNKAAGCDMIYKQPYGGVKPWDEDWVHRRFKFAKGVMLEKKADGMTLMIDLLTGGVRTRQGQDVSTQMATPLDCLFRRWVGADLVLHVEAMLYEEDFSKLIPRPLANGRYNAVFSGEEVIAPNRMKFMVLDAVDRATFYGQKQGEKCAQDRYDDLVEVVRDYDDFPWDSPRPELQAIPMCYVYSLEEARATVQRWISEGEEGGILKAPEGIWQSTKMATQMKMKNEFECTLRCIGYKEHSKKPGWVGSLLLQSDITEDDVLYGRPYIQTYAGSGLNEQDGHPLDRRQGFAAFEGRLFEIRAEKISKNNALDLPRIIEPRLDKTEADTYAEVLAAYNDSISVNNC